MSAIWGIVNINNEEVDYSLGVQMEQAMRQYKLDRCSTIKKENAVFGCGIQYITPEAVNERLPYYDESNEIFYTADCMLDNREELIKLLSEGDYLISDGLLLYRSYLKWGEKFPDYVLGVFSMVIYNKRNNTCYLYTDHTASRSLYYCVVNNTIYFATIFAPLLAVLPKEDRRFNDKWIAACELVATPIMEFYPGNTPFEKINQVPAGYSVVFRMHGSSVTISRHCYWELKKMKMLKLNTQEEYKELFIKTLTECIQSVLRSDRNTAITLSSGLDSSSVACVAAQLLDKENKKLYSYTSIPIPEFNEEMNPYFIIDESEGVKCICSTYKNIEPEFVRCEGKNAYSELKRLVQYLEFPHKSRQNMVWLDEIYDRAASNGCKVILKGQFGNMTISQGKLYNRIYDEISHFRLMTAYNEMKLYCKNNNYARKMVLKRLVEEFMNELWHSQNRFEDSVIRKELLERYKIINHINRNFKNGQHFLRSKSLDNIIYSMSFIQLGAIDTRFGLYHGVIIRDPLKDKRMIELCASMPSKCFVHDGTERAVVRKYMRGIVPDKILDIVNQRGLQSADYITRLRLDWDRIRKDMLDALEKPQLLEYISPKELSTIRKEVESNKLLDSEGRIIDALMLSSFSEFLDCFG